MTIKPPGDIVPLLIWLRRRSIRWRRTERDMFAGSVLREKAAVPLPSCPGINFNRDGPARYSGH